MFADIVSLLEQGVPDAGTAVGLTGLSMDDPKVNSRARVRTDRGLSGRVRHAS